MLEQYKRVVAPFDGLATARTTDVGALINAGSGGGPALFVVSDTARLRAYVNVSQNVVPSIRLGTKAQLSVPEYPGLSFPARVDASAQAVDAASGTTRMLLVVDNPNGELMTGAYTHVRFELPHPEVAVNVPASALIFDQDGLRVATVGADGWVALKTITISRDLGKEVEIGSGLSGDDRVIASPPDGSPATWFAWPATRRRKPRPSARKTDRRGKVVSGRTDRDPAAAAPEPLRLRPAYVAARISVRCGLE